jgi:hypothetical protein
MKQLIARTSLAALLATSFGIAQAQGSAVPLAAQAVVSSDRVIPGQDMATHRTAPRMGMGTQVAPADRMASPAPSLRDTGTERTGPNAMGSAGSGKTP